VTATRNARCPRCTTTYPWGTTVCPACHVALELPGSESETPPTILVFETWDRPSADIVVGLLESNAVPCLVRGTGDTTHFGIGPQSFWRVYVRASDEAQAQEILDAEIGREEE
jgi:putative signal transducing protein